MSCRTQIYNIYREHKGGNNLENNSSKGTCVQLGLIVAMKAITNMLLGQ